MTKQLWVEDLTWTEFSDRAADVPYWLLVTGSVEQHGPHLPLGADTLVAERAAELIATRHSSLILGSVREGVTHAFHEWPGSRGMRPETLVDTVIDLATGVASYRKRLVIINGHDENHEPLVLAARRLTVEHDMEVVVVEWAEFVGDVIRKVSSSRSEAHAGEALTSVFLYWYPERVRTERIAPGITTGGELTRDDLHVPKRAHRPVRFTPRSVPSGVIGDPTPATAHKGKVICGALVDRLDALVKEQGWL